MKMIAFMSALTLTLIGSACADELEDPYEAGRRQAREGLQRAMDAARADAEANRYSELE